MLPLINFTSSDIFAADALPVASSLVPEASDALRGGFAEILQSSVEPEILLPTPVGELLPDSGNALPPEAAASQLPQRTPGDPPPPVIDTAGTGLQANPGVGLHPDSANALPATGSPPAALPEIERPPGVLPAMGRPPASLLPPTVQVSTREAGNDVTAAAERPDAMLELTTVVGVPATIAPADQGVSPAIQDRNRRIDADMPRHQRTITLTEPRTAAAQTDLVAGHEPSLSSRPARGIELPGLNASGERSRPQVIDATIQADNRTNPAAAEGLRVIRDDGSLAPRPAATVALQPSGASADLLQTVESGQRIHTEFAVQMPRHTAVATPQSPVAYIELPVQRAGWDTALAERVTLMANGQLQSAEIRLTPADLGPLRIQVAIEDGAANVSFQAQHALTREAIEQAMPRLREMLAENGLSLGQAHVGDDGAHQKSRDAGTEARSTAAADRQDSETGDLADHQQAATRLADGLVDTFA